MKKYEPWLPEFAERNLSIAFKDLLYGDVSTQEFAYEYLFDLKQELLDDEEYEKLAQFAQAEQIYGYGIPYSITV
tara:strand:+ start:862 stop:1086 length:225 start_codon:yes stop_codon:yes gene_type:complete